MRPVPSSWKKWDLQTVPRNGDLKIYPEKEKHPKIQITWNHSFLLDFPCRIFVAPTKFEETLLQPNNMQFFFVGETWQQRRCFACNKIESVLILEAHHIFSRVWKPSCELKGHFYYRLYIHYLCHPMPHFTRKSFKTPRRLETHFPHKWGHHVLIWESPCYCWKAPQPAIWSTQCGRPHAAPRMPRRDPKKNTSRMFPARPPSRSLLMHLLKSYV